MKRILLLVLVLASGFACGETPSRPGRLVIVLAVDQMLPDYLDPQRFQYSGGFKRLTQEGFSFNNADLNYAITLTGPGHATLSTGAYPRTHGIIANDWIDPLTKSDVYCVSDASVTPVEGEGSACSPKNLMVTSLGDWLKASSPGSRVVSIAGKDRSAVLMGGKKPDLVFWFDLKTEHMVTSSYYMTRLPDWVKAFHQAHWMDRNLPATWTSVMFSHPLEGPERSARQQVSPFFDQYVLEFAAQAIEREHLGQRGVTDLLFVGLSATDIIGHTYTPSSWEMRDHLSRLDVSLGKFMTRAEKLAGSGNILLALSADHGVFPNLTQATVQRLQFDSLMQPVIRSLDQHLRAEWRIQEPVVHAAHPTSGNILNYQAVMKKGISGLTLEKRLRSALTAMNGIADVYFRRELQGNTPERPFLTAYRNSFYPPLGSDFYIRGCEQCLFGADPATHGSPYKHDTHVPLLFWGTGIPHASSATPVYTVDLAPTLATLLGIPYPNSVDGHPLSNLLK